MPSAAGGDRPPDRAGDDDDRDDVGQGLQELARDREVADRDAEELQAGAERAGEAEQHGAGEGGPRPPLAEDEGGEGDEAGAVGHVVLEAGLRLEREPGAGQPGDQPADHHGPVADADRVDAERLGGVRVLADGADPQPEAGVAQHEPGQADDDEHGEEDRLCGEELVTDDREVGQAAAGRSSGSGCRWRCRCRRSPRSAGTR